MVFLLLLEVAPVGVHVVIRKSGANVQANEAVIHLRWNVEEATGGDYR
jgi:hypothetical protein